MPGLGALPSFEHVRCQASISGLLMARSRSKIRVRQPGRAACVAWTGGQHAHNRRGRV